MEKNMSLTKVAMPEQEPNVRNKNFKEVALGYTKEMAMEEARRCLNCKHKPCMNGCPVNVPIPGFIEKVAEGDFEAAYEIITSENALPAICGRVCPQENQCEGQCVRGIKGEPVAIGRLERFVADYHMANAGETKIDIEKNGKKVAVVGCGPAGITCAGELIKKGYEPPIHDFEIINAEGEDLTWDILESEEPVTLVVMYDLKKADKKQMAKVEALANNVELSLNDAELSLNDAELSLNHFYILTGSGTDDIINFCLEYPTLSDCICTCDPVTLKTIVRANPGAIVVQNGIVIDKYNLRDRD